VRRHSGEEIVLTERERRAPLVFLWPRVWRYLRHGITTMRGLSISLVAYLVFLGTALASMPVYALLGRRRIRRVEARVALLMGMGNFLVHWFMWFITPGSGWRCAWA
jgi:hypothetical protein